MSFDPYPSHRTTPHHATTPHPAPGPAADSWQAAGSWQPADSWQATGPSRPAPRETRRQRPAQGTRTHSLHYAATPPAYHQETRDRTYLGPRFGELRAEVRRLRVAYRWQRRAATLVALGCFTAYVLLTACAPSLMAFSLGAGLSLGLLLGLLQVPLALLAVVAYECTARRTVDPIAARLNGEPAGGRTRPARQEVLR